MSISVPKYNIDWQNRLTEEQLYQYFWQFMREWAEGLEETFLGFGLEGFKGEILP